jgi:hypothetical protein
LEIKVSNLPSMIKVRTFRELVTGIFFRDPGNSGIHYIASHIVINSLCEAAVMSKPRRKYRKYLSEAEGARNKAKRKRDQSVRKQFGALNRYFGDPSTMKLVGTIWHVS